MKLFLIPGMALLLTGLPCPAAGQQRGPGPETSLVLGPSGYDLSGNGTAFALNFGSTSRLTGRSILIEANFGYFTYTTQFGSRRHYLFPEIGVQAQAGLGSLRPYLGAGIGMGIDTQGGPSQLDLTLHAVTGVRISLSGMWGARLEARLRSVDPFQGHTTDFGVGLIRGFR
jgi:hypothetical protein